MRHITLSNRLQLLLSIEQGLFSPYWKPFRPFIVHVPSVLRRLKARLESESDAMGHPAVSRTQRRHTHTQPLLSPISISASAKAKAKGGSRAGLQSMHASPSPSPPLSSRVETGHKGGPRAASSLALCECPHTPFHPSTDRTIPRHSSMSLLSLPARVHRFNAQRSASLRDCMAKCPSLLCRGDKGDTSATTPLPSLSLSPASVMMSVDGGIGRAGEGTVGYCSVPSYSSLYLSASQQMHPSLAIGVDGVVDVDMEGDDSDTEPSDTDPDVGSASDIGAETAEANGGDPWVACTLIGYNPLRHTVTVHTVQGETYSLHASCFVPVPPQSVAGLPETLSLQGVLELDGPGGRTGDTAGSILMVETQRIRQRERQDRRAHLEGSMLLIAGDPDAPASLEGTHTPETIQLESVDASCIDLSSDGSGDMGREGSVTDGHASTNAPNPIPTGDRAKGYEHMAQETLRRIALLVTGREEGTLPKDVQKEVETSLLAARSTPLSTLTCVHYSPRDALSEVLRIGKAEVKARAAWLQDNLMVLDPVLGPSVRQYQTTLSEVVRLLQSITPQAVLMDPQRLLEGFKVALFELSSPPHIMVTPLPHVTPSGDGSYSPQSVLESLDSTEEYVGMINRVLQDVVRERVLETLRVTSKQDIETLVKAEVVTSQRNQLSAIVKAGTSTPGTIQSVCVDESCLRAHVSDTLRHKARRTLRMLDVMAAACLGTAGDLFSLPWRAMLEDMHPEHYLTPPCMSLPRQEQPPTPTSASGRLDSDTQIETGLDIWAYVQGNHAVKVVTPGIDGSPPSVTVAPVPKYPVYVLPVHPSLSAHEDTHTHTDTDPDTGDGHVLWEVTGPLTKEQAPEVMERGMWALMKSFSVWQCTHDPSVHSPTETLPLTQCMPSYADALRAPYCRVIPPMLQTHRCLTQAIEKRLNQPLCLSDHALLSLTGVEGGYAALFSCMRQAGGDTVKDGGDRVLYPPSILDSALSREVCAAEKAVLQDFEGFILSLPETAYYGGGMSDLTAAKTAMLDTLHRGRMESRDRHCQLLGEATLCALRTAQAVNKSLTADIRYPSELQAVQRLLETLTQALGDWEACVELLRVYCDTLLTDGCLVPIDTHVNIARVTSFVTHLPSSLSALETSTATVHQRMMHQMQCLDVWLKGLSSELVSKCRAVSGLSSTLAQAYLQDTGMEERGVEDSPDAVVAAFSPIVFPASPLLVVSGDEGSAEGVDTFIAESGLVLALEVLSGLPVTAQGGAPTSAVLLPRSLGIVSASVGCMGMQNATPNKAFVPYTRPKKRCDVSLCEVLGELVQAIGGATRCASVLSEWQDMLGHTPTPSPTMALSLTATGGESPTDPLTDPLMSVPGHPSLLHRCLSLLRDASAFEVGLSSVPVQDLDPQNLKETLSSMGECVHEMHDAYLGTEETETQGEGEGEGEGVGRARGGVERHPNLTFSQALHSKRRALMPTIELVCLLASPALQQRHLDVLESETGLPVLRLGSVTCGDLLSAGALSMLDTVTQAVQEAEAEAEVETRLDACDTAMETWTAEVAQEKVLQDGFPLPDSFFDTLRSIILFVQRDVGSQYPLSITARARQLERTALWAMHTGSLLLHAQQYLSLGHLLVSPSGNERNKHIYHHAVRKWYLLRRSVSGRARARLLDVLMDSDLAEGVHGLICSLTPVVHRIQARHMHQSLACVIDGETEAEAEGSVGEGDDVPQRHTIRGLMTVPDNAHYMETPHLAHTPPHLVPLCDTQDMFHAIAPLSLFHIDGFIVSPVHIDGPLVSGPCMDTDTEDSDAYDSEGEADRETKWVITGLTSCVRDPTRTEVLHLLSPVDLPRVRGLLARVVRQPMRDAFRHECDMAIQELEEGDMTAFWARPFHAQFVGVSTWLHDTLRRACFSCDLHDAPSAIKTAGQECLAQLTIPLDHPRVHVYEYVTHWAEKWLNNCTYSPDAHTDNPTDTDLESSASGVYQPVLSAMCLSRYMYSDKAPLCISSLGVHLRHFGYDWLGAVTQAELPPHGFSRDDHCRTDYATPQLMSLLGRGVTAGLCASLTASLPDTTSYICTLARFLGNSLCVVCATQHRDPADMACQLSNLLLEGHCVLLVGLESAPTGHVDMVGTIAQTLHAGGEMPYASGPERPYLQSTDTDLCVVRPPLGKGQAHPSEHSVGTLLVYLPVLVPGPFIVPKDMPQNGLIRYIDIRPPPERLRYIPKSTGRPCLALRNTYAQSGTQLFLEPSDVAVAMRISTAQGLDLGGMEEGDRYDDESSVSEGERERERGRHGVDTPETAILKYLSVSFAPDAREGLHYAVAAAFGSSYTGAGDLDYGEGHGLLSGIGVYTAKCMCALMEGDASMVWVQSDCVHIARAVAEHAAHLAHKECVVRLHPEDMYHSTVPQGVWEIIDMSFDRHGLHTGRHGDRDHATHAMLGKHEITHRCIYISPTAPTHTHFRCHHLRVGVDALRLTRAFTHALEHSTGTTPDIADTTDSFAFFLGAVSRFVEILDSALGVELTGLQGSFMQALCMWTLSEWGAVVLRPHPSDIQTGDAENGRIHVPQLHADTGVFSLPNVGPVMHVHPSPVFFSSFGSDSPMGHSVSLFMAAFACVYSSYSVLSALRVCYSPDIYNTMVDITTQEHALDSLRATHAGFVDVSHQAICDCFPEGLEPEAFEALRFNPDDCQMELYTLRDPVAVDEFFMTHPRWTLPPVLTPTNRAFCHGLAACMTFGVPAVLTSGRRVGKTWAVHAAGNLLPPFCHHLADVSVAGDTHTAGLSNHTTRASDGTLVPVFSHCLCLSLDLDSTSHKHTHAHEHRTAVTDKEREREKERDAAKADTHAAEGLLKDHTFAMAVSRSVCVADLSVGVGDGLHYIGRDNAQDMLEVEQDDGLCCSSRRVGLEGISLVCETHFQMVSDDDGETHETMSDSEATTLIDTESGGSAAEDDGDTGDQAACHILPSYAFVFNADQLVDMAMLQTLFESVPLRPTAPEGLRAALLTALIRLADCLDLSPLAIMDSMRRLGLLATRTADTLYYASPAVLLMATTRCVGEALTPRQRMEAKACFDHFEELGLTHSEDEAYLLKHRVSPTDRRGRTDILSGLMSGPGAPASNSVYRVTDCFSPLLKHQYPLTNVLSDLETTHPDIVPNVLRTAVQTECWLAVNNTVANTVEDVGLTSGLRELVVPTMCLALLDKDTADVYPSAQLLFKTLHCTVNLTHMASSGFQRQSNSIRKAALHTNSLMMQAGSDGPSASLVRADRNWDTTSQGSLRSSQSLGSNYTAATSVTDHTSVTSMSSQSFFGSQHERYLPRLVIDMDTLRRGLGIAESHESPIQDVVWTALHLPSLEDRIAALVRLSIILSCGLPVQMALPLVNHSRSGVATEVCVPPYKVFPHGDVNSPLSSKYQSDRTLFSRVVLHIPGEMLASSSLLAQTVIAFQTGIVPPVFSRAALGQLYMALGEKYPLPQPDSGTLTMKMAQHLAVIVTTHQPPEPHLRANCNTSYPSPMCSLLDACPPVYRYLQKRYGGSGTLKPSLFKVFIRHVAGMFSAVCHLHPEVTPEFDKYVSFAMSAMEGYYRRDHTQREELTSALGALESHEAYLSGDHVPQETRETALSHLANIKAGIAKHMPHDETDEEEQRDVIVRGANIGLLYLYTEQFWSNAEAEPEFNDLKAKIQRWCGLEDMHGVSVSVSLFVCALTSRFHFLLPDTLHATPFLWLYAGALPPSDSALLSCVRACFGSVHCQNSVPFLAYDEGEGVTVARCVDMWRAGLLTHLSADKSAQENRALVEAAQHRCPMQVLDIDLPPSMFYPTAVKALEAGTSMCICSSSGRPHPLCRPFLTGMTHHYMARDTRAGQVLTFQNRHYVVRLRHPIHKMRMYLTLDPSLFHPCVSLLDCTPVHPTLTVQILDVLERASGESDTGPLHQAALVEASAYHQEDMYWDRVGQLTAALVSTPPSPASVSILQRGAEILGVAEDLEAHYHHVADMWARPGVDFGLTLPVHMIQDQMSVFPAPLLVDVASIPSQMDHLETVLEEHVQEHGYSSICQETMHRLFHKACGRLIADTAEPNCLHDLGQTQVLMLLLDTVLCTCSGSIHKGTAAATMLVAGAAWDALETMASTDSARLDSLMALTQTRSVSLTKYPQLRQALERVVMLEAAAPDIRGLTEALLTSDSAFGDAVMLVCHPDAGLCLLSSLLSAQQRPSVLGGRDVKKRFRLPSVLGTAVCDKTLLLHYAVLCCLNPPAALISIGAWVRAMSSGVYMQGVLDTTARHQISQCQTALSRGIPKGQVDVVSVVEAVVSSTLPESVGVITHPEYLYGGKHLSRALTLCGHQPLRGLYRDMPPDRVSIVDWESIKHRRVTDPLFHSPSKIVVLIPRHAETANRPLANWLIHRSVSRLCIPCESSPIQTASHKIPQPVLSALSGHPTTQSPSPSVPVFVSPAFSIAMRRVLTGLLMTFVQRPFHATGRLCSGIESNICIDLSVRQIATLSRCMVHYGQDANHVFDQPLVSKMSGPKERLGPHPTRGMAPRGSGSHLSRAGDVRIVGQASLDPSVLNGLIRHPLCIGGALTWTDRFMTVASPPMHRLVSRRFLRALADTVCTTGPASHIIPCQVELPGATPLSGLLATDMLRVRQRERGNPQSQRTGLSRGSVSRSRVDQSIGGGRSIAPSAASRAPSNASYVSRVSHQQYGYSAMDSHRDRGSVAGSVNGSVSGSVCRSSRGSEYSTASAARTKAKRKDKHGERHLAACMEHVAEAIETVHIGLLYPDSPTLHASAVSNDIAALTVAPGAEASRGMVTCQPGSDMPSDALLSLAHTQGGMYKVDPLRCASRDVLSVISLQDTLHVPSALEEMRDTLRRLQPLSLSHPHHRHRLYVQGEVSQSGTLSRGGGRGRTGGADLDDASYCVLETLDSTQSVLSHADICYFLYKHPVPQWADRPMDCSAFPHECKRALLFSLMVLFANVEGIRQSDCHFVVSLTPPLPDRRHPPVVTVQARMHGFRMSADHKTPVQGSYLMPEDLTTLYVHCGSERHGTRDREGGADSVISDTASESSLSLISMQSSDMRHLSRPGVCMPGLSTLSIGHATTATIPVVLEHRQIGKVTVTDYAGQDHWVSAGAHFNIM
ncbi:hypothetical protein KIPB_000784 [Kipferlia bialata]|uniref:Dynein heavy chain linker domain-containing protein n=1 Tax=Kipferlia bialata TaxID=797122 RepID=A0A9K3GES7_9EUKA|nr:hypothetical protein KIPB_000784 [Kipferlia bialata]|eukprot:g784.t1